MLCATFCNAIILRYTKNIYKICNCKPHPWKQISQRLHWCSFHSNWATFEKVIAKIQRSPDFMKHDNIKVRSGDFWPARDWSKPTAVDQSAEIWEGGDWTTTSDCLLFITAPSSLFQRQTDGQMILWKYITQTDYRVIAIYKTAPCGTFSQLPWTWTWCEVTVTERDTSCDRSVVGTSRQSLRVASRADCLLFILWIPLSPTSLLTDVRGGVAMRKSVKHSFFCK